MIMVVIDFDTRNDLIPWVPFAAIGVGVVLSSNRGNRKPGYGDSNFETKSPNPNGYPAVSVSLNEVVSIWVTLMAILSVVTLGGFGTGLGMTTPDTFTTNGGTEHSLDLPYNETEKQTVYWNKIPPRTCRIFAAYTQYQLVKKMGLADSAEVRYFEVECGKFSPAWKAFSREYGLR